MATPNAAVAADWQYRYRRRQYPYLHHLMYHVYQNHRRYDILLECDAASHTIIETIYESSTPNTLTFAISVHIEIQYRMLPVYIFYYRRCYYKLTDRMLTKKFTYKFCNS